MARRHRVGAASRQQDRLVAQLRMKPIEQRFRGRYANAGATRRLQSIFAMDLQARSRQTLAAGAVVTRYTIGSTDPTRARIRDANVRDSYRRAGTPQFRKAVFDFYCSPRTVNQPRPSSRDRFASWIEIANSLLWLFFAVLALYLTIVLGCNVGAAQRWRDICQKHLPNSPQAPPALRHSPPRRPAALSSAARPRALSCWRIRISTARSARSKDARTDR